MDLLVVLIHQCLAESSAGAMQAGSVQPGLQLSGSGLSSNTHMGLLGLFVYILVDVVAHAATPVINQDYTQISSLGQESLVSVKR